MKAPQRILTVVASVAAGACATSDVAESQYDEVARIVGAGFTTIDGGGELGAFADSAQLARGRVPVGFKRHGSGLVEGMRGPFTHRYFVVCTDARGFAVDACGPATERAIVLASWSGPVSTDTHAGTLRRGGYWTIYDPWQTSTMIAGDTWLRYEAGTYDLEDGRDIMLVIHPDTRMVTAGGMTATINLHDGAVEQDIHGDIALTSKTATVTLDGVHTTVVDVTPIVIR
jgi:hypothetical protein